jgi:hypothetical protein
MFYRGRVTGEVAFCFIPVLNRANSGAPVNHIDSRELLAHWNIFLRAASFVRRCGRLERLPTHSSEAGPL